MKIFLLIVFTGLCFVSCKESQIPEPGTEGAYDLWKSKNIHNYSIEQVRMCFCNDAGERVRITVRSGIIKSIVRISDGQEVTGGYYHSVDSLFELIKNSEKDSLEVKFNKDYGYPEYLDINPQLHPVDGGVLYTTANLHVE